MSGSPLQRPYWVKGKDRQPSPGWLVCPECDGWGVHDQLDPCETCRDGLGMVPDPRHARGAALDVNLGGVR